MTAIDLRPTRSNKISGHFYHYGGRVYVEWTSSVKIPNNYNQDGKEQLLWNEEVEEFLHECVSNHDGLEYSESKNIYDGIGFYFEFEDYRDVPEICETFRKRMEVAMTCISWRQCKQCNSVDLRFINPDELDTVWKETNYCDCEEDYDTMVHNGDGPVI
jgi:hypothetical protein